MTNNNTPSVSVQAYLRSGGVQQRIEALVGERAGQFTTTLMSVINGNSLLQECTPTSVLTAAITAAGLDLTVEPSLGQSYIIPYRNKKTEKYYDDKGVERTRTYYQYEAQFQIGAKGFKQLALRSGAYKRLNVTDVREGEYKGKDRRTGELQFEWVDNDADRNKLKIVGYLSYFKLRSGTESELYMTVDEITAHAKKYSQSFKKGWGNWVDDFDSMSRKTVMKLHISRDGITSAQLQTALLADQAAVEEDSYKYVDNDKTPTEAEADQTPPEEKKEEANNAK